MHPLEKQILTCIRENHLLNPAGESLVIGVSGGPDSLCLLHLLARINTHLNLNLIVAHINHGLRPAEADRERNIARDAAVRYRATFETTVVDVKEYATRNKLSVEHAARILRYDFLDRVAEKHQAVKIALAHTADDQAEEILLRLLKGTGRAGLAGMKTLHRGKYIRPLLTIPKAPLLNYLADIMADFAEDSSNRQRRYVRNKIRLDLLPYLAEKFNPNISQNLRQTAEILSDEEDFLATITSKACETILSECGSLQESSANATTPHLTIDLTGFNAQHRAVQRRILEESCLRMRNTPYSRQIKQLLQLAARQGSDGMLHFARGLRVTKTGDRLLFSYPAGVTTERGDLFADSQDTQEVQLKIPGPGKYRVEELDLSVQISIFNKTEVDYKTDDSYVEYLDADRLSFPLMLKTPEPGDRFHPLGSPGSKKVADFLCDQKVERDQREQVAMLLSGDTIIALLGHRISHEYRITSQTTRVARIQWAKSSIDDGHSTPCNDNPR